MRPNAVTLAFWLLAIASEAQAATVRVMISGGLNTAYRLLAPQYEMLSKNKLTASQGASMGNDPSAIPARLDRGEPADVVIMARSAVEGLVAKGQVVKESVTDLGIGHIAMAVKAGAKKPDIHTVFAFRQALLAAKSVAYTDSVGGIYLRTVLFRKLGIEKAMAAKCKMIKGKPVGPSIASGEYQYGFQQLSELKPIPGIYVVGLIPDAVQLATTFSAGMATRAENPAGAHSLISFLNTPAAFSAIKNSGLEPVHRSR